MSNTLELSQKRLLGMKTDLAALRKHVTEKLSFDIIAQLTAKTFLDRIEKGLQVSLDIAKGEEAAEFSPAVEEHLKRMGLTVNYQGVTDEHEARERWLAHQESESEKSAALAAVDPAKLEVDYSGVSTEAEARVRRDAAQKAALRSA